MTILTRRPWAIAVALFIIASALFLSAGMAHADTGDTTSYDGNGLAAFFGFLIAAPFVAVGLYLVICGLISAYIASAKGRNSLGFFVLGVLFLGPLAIAVAILATPITAEDRQQRQPRQGFAKLVFGR